MSGGSMAGGRLCESFGSRFGASFGGPSSAPQLREVDERAPLLQTYNTSSSSATSPEESCMEKTHRSRIARFVDKLAVESEPGLTNAQLMLANPDLKPVEPKRRQWRTRNFVAFWIADSFNINTWIIASASILDGLSWWQAWLCVWIGYAIAAVFVCLTGRIGATYHISFPVVIRASFGIWGSLWPVLNRAIIACIWYGVQSWIGGTCVSLMLCALTPSWDDYGPDGSKNTMSKSSGTNTRDFVSFFLFWLASLPFLWFPVHKIRHLFTVKAYVVPTAGISFFIWAIVRAHGIGPVVHKPATKHGSDLFWVVIKSIMSAVGNFATLIVGNSDFSRFALQPRDALWSQIFTIPCGFALTSIIGIITASSSTVIFNGQTIWSPLELLKLFLDEEGVGIPTRLGVFAIAAAFVLAQLGTNIAANSVSAGTDFTALVPRYLNIRRGSYICATLGIAICPWFLLKSSNSFTTYLSAYSIFLSSIAGVIVADYFLVRQNYLETGNLYSARKDGPYYYTWGVHWRGYAAYIAGILINIVGFSGAVGIRVPIGATYIYNLNFFCGFAVSLLLYWLFCKIWTIPATSDTWTEVDDDSTRRNSNPVYDFELSDKARTHSQSTDHMLRTSTEEGPYGPNSEHRFEAGSAKRYELHGLLATDPE